MAAAPARSSSRLPNIQAREWVEQRLHRVARRLVDRWLGDAVEIAYTGPEARSGLDPPAGLVGQAVLQPSYQSAGR